MTHWQRLTDFTIRLPDRPGALAGLAARLRQADVGLLGLWGASEPDGSARFHCVPENEDQFRNFAASADLPLEEGLAFFLQAAHSSAIVEVLDAIGRSGINLRAIEGVAQGEAFGCFLWADRADWPALERLLAGQP